MLVPARPCCVVMAIIVAGCGRIGYDALGGDGDGGTGPSDGGDGGVPTLDGGSDAGADGGGTSGTCAPSGDYCSSIPALPAAPVIDGALDCGAALRTVVPVGWAGLGAGPPAGESAQLALAWRADGLYVYALVTDPSRVPAPGDQESYCGDAIEMFVDANGVFPAAPGFDEPGTRAFIVAAPANAVTPSTRGETFGAADVLSAWTSTRFGAFPVAGGYVVEAFITAQDLGLASWPLASNGTIGFDLIHDISSDFSSAGPCMSRIGQYFLRITAASAGCDGAPFCDVGAFCTPALAP